MSKKTLVIPKPTFYYKDLPAGHARLEVPTPPHLPVAQYLMIVTYPLAALYKTYEAFRTLSSSDKSWPPSWEFGNFVRDESGHIRFVRSDAIIIGGLPDRAYDEDQTLEIFSWHYGSPTLIELVGIEEVLKMTGRAIAYIVDRKHNRKMHILEEQKAKRDLALKEYELWEKWYALVTKGLDTWTKVQGLTTPESGSQLIPHQLLPPPPHSLEILTQKTELYLGE